MADLVSPIVDIISRLWTCCARHTRYLCKLQQNMDLLRNAMKELTDARNDVHRTVIEAEADLNEPKMRTDSVSGWLHSVEKIEGEVEVILQKANEQLSRARCLGGCCPPNNCWSNYKLGKSIAKKIPLVHELKVKGDFQELTYVARPTNCLSKLQDNKILLRRAMDELKNVRNDVQRKVVEAEADQSEPKMRTDQVRGWLQSVENIEREVEVILQTSDEQLSNAECHEKNKLVVMKKAYVDELKVNGKFEEVTYRLPPPSVQDMNLEPTVGMESMFDKVWRRLVTSTTDDQAVRIMGLYGQGGVGKTTLLEKINNEFHNKISIGEHGFDYDVVMFVVVSKPINYEDIQKKIGDRLGLSNSLQGDGDEKSRAQKIFNVLRNKNYVLLLDDIWEDQFDKKRIGIPIHPSQGNSSKLIFTTRSERVCGLMEATHTFPVECLPWDKAWRLFQNKVGEKALNYLSGGARELAKDVAKECGGLPLVLITIGRAMSTKKSVQEWRDARKTLLRYAAEFKDMNDEVLPRLKLSYDCLHNEKEKSCFRYCALFPEDYSIEIAKLVDYWIAEGFLNGFDNNLDEARNRGHTIIGSLKSACLLESSDEHRHEKTHVKMHDVIRDLALWIVNDCRSSSDESGSNSNKFLVAGNDYPCNKKWENAERIFWDATHYIFYRSSSNEEENPPTSLNLITLFIVQIRSRLPPTSFFQHMPLLRVLDLSNTLRSSDDEFPMSICELHELRYLNLSGTGITELPIELRKLVKLKFLVFKSKYGLRRIPAGVINLSELQVLNLRFDFFSSGLDDWELEGGASFTELDGLKQLQEVRITITTYVARGWDHPHNYSICCKKFLVFNNTSKLQMVCTGLRCEGSSPSSSRRVLDLSIFKSLKDLELISGFSGLEELILYGSTTDGGLLSTLETLSLDCLPKLNSILWTAAEQPDLLRSHLHILHYISIAGCDALKDLTWLVYVQNLETLNVRDCDGLETIIELGDDGLEGVSGDDQMLNTRGVFRRLKILNMNNVPKLKSICRHALDFPSIDTICILECPELKKLPLGSGSNVENTLKRIEGSTSWWNELQWEDETIKPKFLPYFYQIQN